MENPGGTHLNQTLRTGIDTLGNRADSTMGTKRHVILVVALAAACFAQNDVDAIIRGSV